MAWVPLPLARTAPYQIDRGHTVGGNADKTRVEKLAGSGAAVLVADWGHMMPPPELTVTMKVETSEYRVPLTAPNGAKRTADLANYLKPTKLIPVDGIVKQTADAITKGKTTDLAKARAIYDWIVENTVRDADVKGCGLGDIRGMLEMKNLERQVRGSQCALRRAGPRIQFAGARSLRTTRRGVSAVSQPWPRRRQRDDRAALPRRSVGRQLRLDPRRSRRRAEADARGEEAVTERCVTSPGRARRCSDPGR